MRAHELCEISSEILQSGQSKKFTFLADFLSLKKNKKEIYRVRSAYFLILGGISRKKIKKIAQISEKKSLKKKA